MYSKIINPKTGRKVSINSKLGSQILKKYVTILRGGADSLGAPATKTTPPPDVGPSLDGCPVAKPISTIWVYYTYRGLGGESLFDYTESIHKTINKFKSCANINVITDLNENIFDGSTDSFARSDAPLDDYRASVILKKNTGHPCLRNLTELVDKFTTQQQFSAKDRPFGVTDKLVILIEQDIFILNNLVSCNESDGTTMREYKSAFDTDFKKLKKSIEENSNIIMVSSPKILELCGNKSFYAEEEFAPFIVAGTKYFTKETYEADGHRISSVPDGLYVFKRSNSSGGNNMHLDWDRVDVARILPMVMRSPEPINYNYILQPKINNIEWKFGFINGKIKYYTVNIKLLSDTDLHTFSRYILESQLHINYLVKLIYHDLKTKAFAEDWITSRYELADVDIEDEVAVKKRIWDTLHKLIETSKAASEAKAMEVLDVVTAYNNGSIPIYIRIDIFYDTDTHQTYLNELEPYASGKGLFWGNLVPYSYRPEVSEDNYKDFSEEEREEYKTGYAEYFTSPTDNLERRNFIEKMYTDIWTAAISRVMD